MEKPEQPGGTPSARQTAARQREPQTAPQQREPQIGAQTAARQEETRQTPPALQGDTQTFPAPQPWEYGQPRIKSKNAALLQWGCALVILLCAASALLFAFLPIFPYSADGADGAFSAFELVQNGAAAYNANGSLVAVCALYLCIALLAPIFLAALLTHAGSYTRNMRKLAWVFSMLQTMWNVVSAGLYILAVSLSSGSESSALPFVYCGLSIFLFVFACILYRAKNADEQAGLTVWDTLGVRAACAGYAAPLAILFSLGESAILLVFFLCIPLHTNELFTYTLPDIYNSLLVWKDLASMDTGRILCIVLFVLLALGCFFRILFSALYAAADGDEKKMLHCKGLSAWGFLFHVAAFILLAAMLWACIGESTFFTMLVWLPLFVTLLVLLVSIFDLLPPRAPKPERQPTKLFRR